MNPENEEINDNLIPSLILNPLCKQKHQSQTEKCFEGSEQYNERKISLNILNKTRPKSELDSRQRLIKKNKISSTH